MSGAVAAAILGTLVFGFGGLQWSVLLLTFFLTSSLLSKLFRRKKGQAEEKFSKGSRRDAWQVLANGGISGVAILLQIAFPEAVWPFYLAAGSLAAANADTWATELGVLSPTQPRLITSLKPVEKGTSGAVSQLGSLAALGGSALIALAAVLVSQTGWLAFALITIAGFIGSLVDSLLGATIQAQYWCTVCDKVTEKHPRHGCGTDTTLHSGWRWMNNDAVNLLCTLTGGIAALLLLNL